MHESLCDIAKQFPVGARVRYSARRDGVMGTVIDAIEREETPSLSGEKRTPSKARVGSAFIGTDGLAHIAVRWDHSILPGNVGAGRVHNLSIVEAPAALTQADLDRAVQDARATAYHEGVREGLRRSAAQVKSLGLSISRSAR